jgi:hypothetical protein
MRTDLPAPDEIMEELADRAVSNLDRRAPVAFEASLDELVRYHRFLLTLNATENEDGTPFSYAEVSGAGWHAPHIEWIRPYRRLFGRAAERIPDEERFLDALAYVPHRLLDTPHGVGLSKAVVETILDLQPMLVHAVEAWVTRRTIVEGDAANAAERVGLSASDARALAKTMPNVVGAWESLLDRTSARFGWQAGRDAAPEELWSRYAAAWPLMRQHLANTAYCLAVAVWNGDRTSASLFREALVRWPGSALMDVERDGLDRFPWLLMPDLLEKDWAVARLRSARIDHPFLPGPTPGGLFTEIVDGVRRDVVLVTASIMLVWSIGGGVAGELAAVVARELVGGAGADPTEPHATALDFRAVTEGLIRLQMVGERYEDGTHGQWLDRLVSSIDNMREGMVVPGRVYTPTTMHGREQLVLADMALIAALAPAHGTGGVADDLGKLAEDDGLPPRGDRSLRELLMEFRRYRSFLEQDQPGLNRAIDGLTPGVDVRATIARLRSVLDEAEAAIETRRTKRLIAMVPDPETVEGLRAAIEAQVLESPAEVPFFTGVEVGTAEAGEGEHRTVRFNGIGKGNLVRPEMEWPSSNWTEMLASRTRHAAGDYAFQVFARRPRERVGVDAGLDEPEFWRQLAPLRERVGPDAVLIVTHKDAIDRLGRFYLGRGQPLGDIEVSFKRVPRERGHHVARVDGVEVFATNIEKGTAWLLSARHLRRIRYAPAEGERVTLTFDPDPENPIKGTLVMGFEQALDWGEEPVFEIALPDGGHVDQNQNDAHA